MKKLLAIVLVLLMCLSLLPLSALAVESGNTSSKVAGDANGDGSLNGADLVRIRKYLAGMDVEIDLACADINGDGSVNGGDLVRLRKYLAGMEVELVPPKEDSETGLPMPEDPTEADEYYWSNSIVIDVINVSESSEVLTEAEAVALLRAKGFTDYPVVYYYSMDGEFCGETEASPNSSDYHPMYQTYYLSDSGDGWSIFIENGKVFANPVSFNLESDLSAQVLFSESNTLTSYDSESDKFYVTIPYASTVILKMVETTDAETLDKLTMEEIGKQ